MDGISILIPLQRQFASDGVYKIAVSSRDATGNSPENINYDDKTILFRVDSTAPEITSVTGPRILLSMQQSRQLNTQSMTRLDLRPYRFM